MIKFMVMVLFILSCSASVYGASAKVRMTVRPHADRTPPIIMIASPALNRGPVALSNGSKLVVVGDATDDSGVTSVTINGRAVVIDEEGRFSAEVGLNPGQSLVEVVALDINENRASQVINIARRASQDSSARTTVPAVGKNYALVIGINDYLNFSVLHTAVNDARAVAKLLEDCYGFTAKLLLNENATRSAISREINKTKNILNPEDRFLIYYAGHGIYDESAKISYWLPVNAEKDDPTEYLPATEITGQLKRAQARQILVVADSCYAGTMTRSDDTTLVSKGDRENFLQKQMERFSRGLIASGGNEPVSDNGGNGHSEFAEAFISALNNPFKARFTAEELVSLHIKESVAGRSKQTPAFKYIQDSGHDGGDFVFEKLQ